MKKITLSLIVLTAISFASCRKERTCTCTTTVDSYTSATVTKARSSKKDAKNWCDANRDAVSYYDNFAVDGGYTPPPTCKIN